MVWEVGDQGVINSAARLSNGNTLICRQTQGAVVEVTKRGEVKWLYGDLKNPYDAQRLPNGNTLIADFNGVREVTSKGELVWERKENPASRIHRY